MSFHFGNNTTAITTTCRDDVFGPGVHGCRDDFDFTLTFESTILSVVPSAIALLLGAPRIFLLWSKPNSVRGRSFQITKLAALFAYGLLQVVLLVLWSTNRQLRSGASISAATLSLIDAPVFCLLSFLEHAKALRPSAVLILYMSISVLLDATRLRTLWLIAPSAALTRVFTASVALKGTALLLESGEKARFLISNSIRRSPEATSSIANQSVYYWLNRLLMGGASKVLSSDDLYELDEPLKADPLAEAFIPAWRASKAAKRHTFWAVCRVLKWPLLGPVVPRLVLLALTMVQPLLLESLLSYLQDQSPSKSPNPGRGLIAAYTITYLGIALSTALFSYAQHRSLAMIRSTLIAAMSWQASNINASAIRDPSAVVTLMSADVDRITEGLQPVHDVWASLFQVAIATYLLARRLGVACVVPLVIASFCAVGTTLIGRGVHGKQDAWMKAIEARVTNISETVSSMRGIKMRGLETPLTSLIQQLRSKEINLANRFRSVIVWSAVNGFLPEITVPAATFTVYIIQQKVAGQSPDITTLFTSLSLMILLASPLNGVYQSVPGILSAISCIRRVHIFLETDEQKEGRSFATDLTGGDSADSNPTTNYGIELAEMRVSKHFARAQVSDSAGLTSTKNTFETVDASVRWGDGSNVLRGIQVGVPRHGLTFIVGPVASGKSTLCESLLGQTTLSSGRISLLGDDKDIGYCSQTPWLFDASIRENVIGFSPFSPDWYDTVIEAVDLTKDLAERSMSDEAKVGSCGSNLSGGQKKKVAIARAVYSRNRTLIFDDSFAGIDPVSEQHIFSRIFGPSGILKREGVTVLFSTSSLRFLPYADHVIALNQAGERLFEGTFDRLVNVPEYAEAVEKIEQSARENNAAHEQQQKASVEPAIAEKQTSAPDEAEILEKASRQLGDFQVWLYYFEATGWVLTSIFVIYILVTAIFFTLPTLWLKLWADVNDEHAHLGNAFYMGLYWLYQILALTFMGLAAAQILLRMTPRSSHHLHQRILEAMINAPLSFFSATDSGSIINRFAQDMQLIDGELPLNFISFLFCSCVALLQCILIVLSSPWIGLALPPLAFVLYVLQKFYLRTSRQLRLMELESKGPLYTHFLETLSGLSTIRAFGWTAQNLERSHRLLDHAQKPFYLLTMIQQWLALVLNMVVAIITITIVVLAVMLEANGGSIAVALIQILSLSGQLRTVILQWTQVETSLGAVNRVRSFCEQTKAEHRPYEVEEVSANWPAGGAITWNNVVAAYPSRPTEPVIRNLSLSITSGQKVAICGSSGSGKTSLILSLFRMIDYQEGSIIIDGMDLSHIPRRTIRERLNGVPQDPFFLPGTIRFNLDPLGQFSEDTLVEVLERVRLWDNCISTRGGLAAELSDCNFSHGQRQLFCLAVALLRPSKIVLLDEFTSSVDHETDAHMQRIVREVFKDRTIIAIAHRLDTILDFDKVAVLDQGRLVEFDNPTKLLQEPSRFRSLYNGEKQKQ